MDGRAFLQSQIKTQRGNMHISLAFSIGLLLVGVLLTLWCSRRPDTQSIVDMMKFGPLCVTASITAVPLKAFLCYRSRVSLYCLLLGHCGPDSNPDPEVSQLILEAMKGVLKVE